MTVIDWQAELDKRRARTGSSGDPRETGSTDQQIDPAMDLTQASVEEEIIPGVPKAEASFMPSKPLEVEARAREIVADIFNRALVKAPAGRMTVVPPRSRKKPD